MPYWRVAQGDICLRRSPLGLTVIESRRAGPFRLIVDQSPTTLVAQIAGDEGDARCAGSSTPTS